MFKSENIVKYIAAFMGCWALQLSLGITVRNPLTVVFFVLFLWLGEKVSGKNRRALGKAIISLAIAIALTAVFYKDASAGFESTLFKLLTAAVLGSGYFLLGLLLSGVIPKVSVKCKLPDIRMTTPLVMALCLLFWLPYFLYEFPGIMTADSLVQYRQLVGIKPWSNHHPVVHTLTIKLWYDIGMAITGDKIVAIGFYTAFQMIVMAFCCAVLVKHIEDNAGKMLATAFFALVPFNAVFAVTVWKDILFAGISMLLICKVLDIREWVNLNKEVALKKKTIDLISFTVLGILFCLFRSNAFYAYVVWTVCVIVTFRKNLKSIACSLLIVLLTVIVIKGPVMKNMGIISPDFVESLSVPSQQIARIITSDKELTPAEKELIEAVIDINYVKELYAPDFADNIKELIRAGHPEVLENNKGDYFKLWAGLVTKYPKEAIKAWYDLIGGYIYPDVSYPVGNIDYVMNNELGLYTRSLIGGKIVVKTKEILIKLGSFVPLYGMFWSIGTYTWLLAAAIVISIYKKKTILCKLLLFMLIGTLLIASPMVDFRYGYAIVMTMPLWIYRLFKGKDNI